MTTNLPSGTDQPQSIVCYGLIRVEAVMILRNEPVQVRQPETRSDHLGPPNIVFLLAGTALLLVGLSFDWAHLLTLVRFPTGELNNRWVRTDLATLRAISVLVATVLIVSRIFLWRFPRAGCGVGL